jgi:hypothetical protein
MILPLQALSRPLQAQGAKINELATGVVAHSADIARERDGGNPSRRSRAEALGNGPAVSGSHGHLF